MINYGECSLTFFVEPVNSVEEVANDEDNDLDPDGRKVMG